MLQRRHAITHPDLAAGRSANAALLEGRRTERGPRARRRDRRYRRPAAARSQRFHRRRKDRPDLRRRRRARTRRHRGARLAWPLGTAGDRRDARAFLLHGATASAGGLDLRGAGDVPADDLVAYWADRGVTSFKAYAGISRAEMRAAVEEAHRRGLKVTGHLCSVTYPEAVQEGIDNLEHGFSANTALDPGKQPDKCSESRGEYTLEHMPAGSAEANRLIALLVERHVAITSTLPGSGSRVLPKPLPPAALWAMSPSLRDSWLYSRNRAVDQASLDHETRMLRIEMDLERAFVAAGGLLIAGADPVGIGGVLPGFADHREIELLVEAGFTPLQAIRIATLNGATYLGRQNEIGSVAVGKNADLLVVKGDPSVRIDDIENVEIVFKDGAGYDPAKLLESVTGHYCQY
ncbi:MAG: hypothetical protein E6J61_19000 [Deltaproteobacteria bacterium]|nr:MAG: hypothetical protein E6J61_19000 [Deltaproteobacteria bacterium]